MVRKKKKKTVLGEKSFKAIADNKELAANTDFIEFQRPL